MALRDSQATGVRGGRSTPPVRLRGSTSGLATSMCLGPEWGLSGRSNSRACGECPTPFTQNRVAKQLLKAAWSPVPELQEVEQGQLLEVTALGAGATIGGGERTPT